MKRGGEGRRGRRKEDETYTLFPIPVLFKKKNGKLGEVLDIEATIHM